MRHTHLKYCNFLKRSLSLLCCFKIQYALTHVWMFLYSYSFIPFVYNTGGMESKSEKAFRKDCGPLGELRSLVHRDVPFITLTATATKAV